VAYADFARYQGSPALVFVVRQAKGSAVVAVSPECGLDGQRHELAVVEVG
jgi:hypothetical protein